MKKETPGDAPVYLELTVVNAATGDTVIYAGEPATLTLALTNMTGSLIAVIDGSQPSTLEIFLPNFFSLNDLGKMSIQDPNWSCAVNYTDQSLMLTCVKSIDWQNGTALTFSITGVQSSATPPQGGTTQVNPAGMGGANIPSAVNTTTSLTFQEDTGGQADMTQALLVSLEQNVVYVSENSKALITNSLSLNIKNQLATALYTGKGPWGSAPKVLVYFVYGQTSGALNRIDKSIPKDESGWAITSGSIISQGNDWSISKDSSDGSNQPQWLLEPSDSVLEILGTGDASNITFEFDNIVTLNALGHTQMYALFTGFPGYKNHLFVMDIDKQELPQPSVIQFYATVENQQIQSPDQVLNIPLKWVMTGVYKIEIDFKTDNYAHSKPIVYTGIQPIIQHDTYTFQKSINALESETLRITCIAYDGNGNKLNRIEYPVDILFLPVVTAYTGTIQPDGSMVLNWQSEAAENITIPGFDPNQLSTNGSLSIQAVYPLLKNDRYNIQAIQSASLKSQWYAFNQVTQFQVLPPIFIPISGNNLSDISPALGIAVSPDGRYAFVGSWGYGSVIRTIAMDTLTVIQSTISQYIFVGPKNLVVSSDSKYLYAACSTGDNFVVRFSIADDGSLYESNTSEQIGTDLCGIAYNPQRNEVYVTDADSNTLFVLDANSLQVTNSANTGKIPIGVAVSSDGKFVYVPNSGDNTVSILAASEGFAHTYFQVGKSPKYVAVSPDGQHVFVVNTGDNNVSVITNNEPDNIRTIPTGNGPHGIAVSPDGENVFVSNPGDNSITIISVATMQVIQTISNIGERASSVAVSTDGHYIMIVREGVDDTIEINKVYVLAPQTVTM